MTAIPSQPPSRYPWRAEAEHAVVVRDRWVATLEHIAEDPGRVATPELAREAGILRTRLFVLASRFRRAGNRQEAFSTYASVMWSAAAHGVHATVGQCFGPLGALLDEMAERSWPDALVAAMELRDQAARRGNDLISDWASDRVRDLATDGPVHSATAAVRGTDGAARSRGEDPSPGVG